MRIAELIVVEGKDDIAAVKKAVDAEVVCTGGYGFGRALVDVLQAAAERTGVIIFTDPDSAGSLIRRRLHALVPGCKHAYLPQAEGKKGNNIGIENATPESIRCALQFAHLAQGKHGTELTIKHLWTLGLTGTPGADERRRKAGKLLGIGDTNAKQFLNRLNHQGIGFEELASTVARIGG